MKKTYKAPISILVKVNSTQHLLNASEKSGVETGGTVGNEFKATDVSFGRRGTSIWDDEEEN